MDAYCDCAAGQVSCIIISSRKTRPAIYRADCLATVQNKVFRLQIIATSCWTLGDGDTWLQKEI
jgi:hypothetical protein